MGGCCCKGTVSASGSVEVDVPMHVMWKVITDVEAYPSMVTPVLRVQMLPPKPKSERSTSLSSSNRSSNDKTDDNGEQLLRVGSQWTEVRAYEGSEIEMYKTVTVMDEKSFGLSMNFPHEPNMHHTSTLAVQPVNSTSCLLIGTFAVIVPSCFGRFWLSVCKPFILPKIQGSFQKELKEYAAEALKRYVNEKESK